MSINTPSIWATPDGKPGRWGLFWIAIWLFFLIQPLQTAWERRDTVAGWVGIVATLAFAVWYVAVFAYQRREGLGRRSFHLESRQAVGGVGVALVLSVVDCLAIGQDASATAVYLCVLCVMTLGMPIGPVLAGLTAAGFYVAGHVVPGWSPDNSLLLSMLTASVAVFGIQQMLVGNVALRRANAENQALAVKEERNRFARDLHDILGHSLTVITVKAELAGRLMELDPVRARAEVADLERLSRDALADVRRAVSGYRELTLPGEIARAHGALEAAGIEAQLPQSTDEVPGELREVFAWALREGVTNVIRHSGARSCRVLLTPDCLEVRDDGRGLGSADEHGRDLEQADGNGLHGLRERARAAGATVVTRTLDPGFSVAVRAGG